MKPYLFRLLILMLALPTPKIAFASGVSAAGKADLASNSNMKEIPETRRKPDFVLLTNGHVASEGIPSDDNVFSYISGIARASSDRFVIDTSIVKDSRKLATRCGPSPLSPIAIEALVRRTATAYGVDPDLAAAVAWTESRFDRVRNSSKGAHGPMQLIPETAARLGVTDICDPAANIDGGVRYLHRLLDEFKNPLLAAAAYNAGEQAIYDNNGVPAYPETIRYIASVINRQLGVSLPGRPQTSPSNQPEHAKAAPTNDVIGAPRRRFISGVMQF